MQPVNDDATLRHRIYKQLRRAIIMGRRAPGERLSVEELCQTYNYGHQPGARRAADAGPGRAGHDQGPARVFRHQRHAEGATRHARGA